MTYRTILAVDHDRQACATYHANMPGVEVVCGEVSPGLLTGRAIDVLCGGPPCQPFSTAGKGGGAGDERDGLPVFLDCVEAARPRAVIMENVPGLLAPDNLPHFGKYLARLEALGYIVQHRTLDACRWGVPQFRKRVWTWGIRRDLHARGVRHVWPRPTHEKPSGTVCMFGGLEPWVTVREALGLEDCLIQSHADPARGIDEPGSTLRSGGSGHDGCCVRLRRQRGASVERPDHSVEEPSPTITGVEGGRSGVVAVYDARNRARHSVERPAGTILGEAQAAGGGTGYGLIVDTKLARSSQPIDGPAPTIAADGREVLRAYRYSDAMRRKHPPASPASPAPTVMAKWAKGGAEGLLEQGEYVHRLTPDECARLQSVPDDFVWPAGMKDTPKYRIIGNGWACGMAKVIAECVRASDPDAVTVADLFCGGGLGAVGWHGRAWRRA